MLRQSPPCTLYPYPVVRRWPEACDPSQVFEKDNEFVSMVCTCFNVSEEPADISGTGSRALGNTARPFSMESRSQLAVERRREVLPCPPECPALREGESLPSKPCR